MSRPMNTLRPEPLNYKLIWVCIIMVVIVAAVFFSVVITKMIDDHDVYLETAVQEQTMVKDQYGGMWKVREFSYKGKTYTCFSSGHAMGCNNGETNE